MLGTQPNLAHINFDQHDDNSDNQFEVEDNVEYGAFGVFVPRDATHLSSMQLGVHSECDVNEIQLVCVCNDF
jgi:hypothetical protein